MNFENIKASDIHRILLNLLDKINLKRSDKYVPLSRTVNLKYQFQHGMKNLNCLMDHILYWISKIILNIS